jgi:hypothetical protein
LFAVALLIVLTVQCLELSIQLHMDACYHECCHCGYVTYRPVIHNNKSPLSGFSSSASASAGCQPIWQLL